MAATHTSHVCALALVSTLLLSLAHGSLGARRLTELYTPQPSELLTYHNGTVLSGAIPVSVLWYGRFTPAQKAVVSDFLLSLTAASPAPSPSVSQWWNTINQLYLSKAKGAAGPGAHGAKISTQVALAGQVSDKRCSLGKNLKLSQLAALAARAKPRKGEIALVLTAQDVAVEGFCMSRCGLHGVRLGGQLRHAVPRPVRVAVPQTRVWAPGASTGAPERRRGHGRHGDERGEHGGRRRHQPLRRRVLPGPEGSAAGGMHGVPGGIRQRSVPRVRREPGGGRHDGGELQCQRRARQEVPASRAIRPGHIDMLDLGVIGYCLDMVQPV